MVTLHWRARHLISALSSDAGRPLRFACTGGLAGLTQLSLLVFLVHRSWHPNLANAVAFLVAAQVNFALSATFTWPDRHGSSPLWQRWLLFHASIAGMAVLNMLVFVAARTVLPALLAAIVGIGVAALGNFLAGDRIVFRAHRIGWPGRLGYD